MKKIFNKIKLELYTSTVVFSLLPAIHILNKTYTFEVEIGIFKFWLAIVYKKSNYSKITFK